MTNGVHHRTSRSYLRCMYLRTVEGAVALGAVLVFGVSPARSQDEESAKPPTYSVLYTFTGGADGANPALNGGATGLTLDREHNLYGTAPAGGDVSCAVGFFPPGCGVVFKVDKAGKETVLHAFGGPPDGGNPDGGLTRDEHGNLYGNTLNGGTYGPGTAFKVDHGGNETVLYNFTGGSDGGTAQGGMVRDEDGNLYGTAAFGGNVSGGASSPCDSFGCGLVFRLDRVGNYSVLYSFSGMDGKFPNGGLLRDENGNLYGTTGVGGTSGYGTVFKLDPCGKESVLYSFTGGADGGYPFAGLVRDEEGSVYGTTQNGGLQSQVCGSSGCGVVFKVDRAGKETVLYAFTGGTDGFLPYGRLFRREGNLYGTAYFGGDFNGFPPSCAGIGCGVVFKLDRSGKETVLYSFTGYADGANPIQGVIGDEEGNLYGTTQYGGDLASTQPWCGGIGCGVVFKLKLHREHDEDSGDSSTTVNENDTARVTHASTMINPADTVIMDRSSGLQPGLLYLIPAPGSAPQN